jgi:acyl-CoA synthetase (AMP-forming)/AMP-acid ligase II/lysophospholipase L1-like esterase
MKIVCIGDSLTSCGGEGGRFSDILQERFPEHVFVNRGVSGETIADGLRRLESDVLAESPDVVLIELGANDWHRNERAPRHWAADLETIVSRVQATGATPMILGVFGNCRSDDGLPIPKTEGTDRRGTEFHELEESVAARHECPYVPNIQAWIMGRRCCWDATGHPNELGNRRVADAIQTVLEALLGQRAAPVRRPPRVLRNLWDEAVRMAPDTIALVDRDRRMTYAEADVAVQAIASSIAASACADAPTVAAALPNSLDYCLLYWAVARLGGVIVPLNTWLKPPDLAGILATVNPEVLVLRSVRDTALADDLRPHPRLVVTLDGAPEKGAAWKALLAGNRTTADPSEADGEAACIIMHTSGTTGMPKGAIMRNSDVLFNIVAAINAHDYAHGDVNLFTSPMFHCGPFYTFLPLAAYTKATAVIASPTRPDELMQMVQREKVTSITTAPSVVRQLLKLPDLKRFDISSLRLIAYAGSPMDTGAISELRRRFPDVSLHNFFGLTETTSMTHVLRNEDASSRPESIGNLLPGVDAIIVDEELCELPPGRDGELLVARRNVIPAYHAQPGRLEQAIVRVKGREWFRTGDGASVDEEGYFVLKGRRKDMIIVGGENVYALEIEAFLMSHAKVCEAAVVGVPATGARAFLGEQIVAYVVAEDDAVTERDLRGYCFERLPSYKIPQRIIFMDALPRNPSGKVVKAELPGG